MYDDTILKTSLNFKDGGKERTMSKSFSILKNKMSLTAKKAVEEKTSLLLKEVLLHEIREQLHITQEDMAAKLNTKQANVSRTERRRDMKLSTLKRYIEAMGGELDIVAKFASNEVHLNVKEL
jgi:DNA-binding transcriptional regulator YiaG